MWSNNNFFVYFTISKIIWKRIFVATWNVGGKTPTMDLNLNDFLPENDDSDIYVLG
jgi:hypothetical protein